MVVRYSIACPSLSFPDIFLLYLPGACIVRAKEGRTNADVHVHC